MIELTFWGVRGSNPVSGKAFEKIGGHTSCVSVRVNQDQIIIFDAGSGLFDLGAELAEAWPEKLHLFISHPHLDHIMGLPFFAPLWNKQCQVNTYSQHNSVATTITKALLSPPLFPITVNSSNSHLIFHDIAPQQTIQIGTSLITTIALKHPGGSIGYKMNTQGHVICYITDVEHEPEELDQKIIDFVKGCDLLIYDSAYTEEEFSKKRGWGHSTNIRAAEIAKAAGVKKLALFHQDPSHNDKVSDQVEREAQAIFPETIAAYQGLKLRW